MTRFNPVDQDTVQRLEKRVIDLEEKHETMNESITAIKADTSQLLDIMRTGKLGAAFLKYMAGLALAVVGIWAYFKK